MKNKFINLYNLIMEDLEKSSISDDQLKKLDDHVDKLSSNIENDEDLNILKFDNNTKDKIENVILRDNNLSKEITTYESTLHLNDFSNDLINLSYRYPKSYKILINYLKYRDDENSNVGIKIKEGIYKNPYEMLILNIKNNLGLDLSEKDEKYFKDFLEKIVYLKGSKNGANAGRGEVFLSLFFKNGSLSDNKGDVKIGNDLMEVKTPDGILSKERTTAEQTLENLKSFLENNEKLYMYLTLDDKILINKTLSKNSNKKLSFSFLNLKSFSLINSLSGFKRLKNEEKLDLLKNFIKLISYNCSIYLDYKDINDLLKNEWFNLNNNQPLFNPGALNEFFHSFANKIYENYKIKFKFKYFCLYDYKNNKFKIIGDNVKDFFNEFTFSFPTFGGKSGNREHNVLTIKTF